MKIEIEVKNIAAVKRRKTGLNPRKTPRQLPGVCFKTTKERPSLKL
jgi:hypothetical protein